MAGFYDLIPMVSIILFAVGLVGVMVYEHTKTKQTEESSTES